MDGNQYPYIGLRGSNDKVYFFIPQEGVTETYRQNRFIQFPVPSFRRPDSVFCPQVQIDPVRDSKRKKVTFLPERLVLNVPCLPYFTQGKCIIYGLLTNNLCTDHLFQFTLRKTMCLIFRLNLPFQSIEGPLDRYFLIFGVRKVIIENHSLNNGLLMVSRKISGIHLSDIKV